MTNTQKTAQAVLKAPPQQDLKSLIEQSARELGRALPEHMRPERLVRIALTSIRMNPELAKCTPESFLGALFTAAQLGLEPVANQAYLIPFNNKRKIGNEWKTLKECQFVMGYGGLVSLFYRHEKALTITWGIVCEKDAFDYQKGTEPFLNHKEAQGERGEIIGYYAVAHLQGGGKLFEYMTNNECFEHGKKHSKTYDSKAGKFYDNSPWAKDLSAMCLKTVLKKLGKLMPLSYELQRAIQADETSKEYRTGIDDVFDLPSTTSWAQSEQQSETDADGKSKTPKDFLKVITDVKKDVSQEDVDGCLYDTFNGRYTNFQDITDEKEQEAFLKALTKVKNNRGDKNDI